MVGLGGIVIRGVESFVVWRFEMLFGREMSDLFFFFLGRWRGGWVKCDVKGGR